MIDQYMNEIGVSEKRQRTRFLYDKTILCYEHRDNKHKKVKKKPVVFKVKNISYSGMRIETLSKINEGDILVFNLKDGYEIRELKLEIVWSNFHYQDMEVQAGAKFIELKRDDVLFLHTIISKLK
ncbi:hypothetical protein EZV73_24970 [Acidaminobacter sp. JC074]|uniref:PilZ domain-containing protein n=1 Tax=Acidaminobacter sp. JC074 TaxID=2530199 RepID=UPI001F10961F|nr:PilZ domain-containing protein [Acidaminobacter sp. JC074]MCH4890856.1 hypothetical protein [Acidaminobacter sp. JC074]